RLTGTQSLQAIRVVQIALSLFTTFLVYTLARRAFSDRVARVAAVLFWLYPSLIFFDFLILTETLFTLLLTGFTVLLVMLVRKPAAWLALACGLTLGLAALTRSVLWPLPLVLCPLLVAVIDAPVTRRLLVSLAVLAGFALVITPWAIRNTRLQGVVEIVD